MNDVAAIVITYNVGHGFKERINQLIGKVDKIIIVDNGSNSETIDMLKTLNKEITVMFLKENQGIAFALNRGIKQAINNYRWILTLDHDSIVTDNMIVNMLSCYESLDSCTKEKTAMLVPVHIEEKQYKGELVKYNSNNAYKEVLTEITSGALTKSEIYRMCGMYDEKLFIDLVDHDYCLSLNKKGFKIIQVDSAILVHNLGESIKKNILGLTITPTNHSAVRRYYMTRNRHYIWNKYKDDFPSWVLGDKRRFISENLKIILFEKNKMEKLKYIKRGKEDYKLDNFGKIKFNK